VRLLTPMTMAVTARSEVAGRRRHGRRRPWPAAGKMMLGRRFRPSLADSFYEGAQGVEAERVAVVAGRGEFGNGGAR
jgi:hypothetical protein